MSGAGIMIIGVCVLILSTLGAAVAQWAIQKKKKRIREQVYHIYQ